MRVGSLVNLRNLVDLVDLVGLADLAGLGNLNKGGRLSFEIDGGLLVKAWFIGKKFNFGEPGAYFFDGYSMERVFGQKW